MSKLSLEESYRLLFGKPRPKRKPRNPPRVSKKVRQAVANYYRDIEMLKIIYRMEITIGCPKHGTTEVVETEDGLPCAKCYWKVCKECGAIGNDEEFIKKGLCHKENP